MMPKHCHPLDRVCGIKYCVTGEKLGVEYRPGPETFYVEEIIDREALGWSTGDGEYIAYLLEKRGIDTLAAVEVAARELGVPPGNIVYLGLKDSAATTRQHVFIKKNLLRSPPRLIEKKNMRLVLTGYVRRKPRKRHLLGNRFTIRVPGASALRTRAEELVETISRSGLPAYYGYQRFGGKRPNTHVLGKQLLIGDHVYFAEELLYTTYPGEPDVIAEARKKRRFLRGQVYEKKYLAAARRHGPSAYRVLGRIASIYTEAYASYLFNLLLSQAVEKRLGVQELPMPGCSDAAELYAEIARREGGRWILGRLEATGCWRRRTTMTIHDPRVEAKGGDLYISFWLDKAMYASIVMRELFKEQLVL